MWKTHPANHWSDISMYYIKDGDDRIQFKCVQLEASSEHPKGDSQSTIEKRNLILYATMND